MSLPLVLAVFSRCKGSLHLQPVRRDQFKWLLRREILIGTATLKAKDLADGPLPTTKQNGNFVLGPTHQADAETTAKEGVPKGEVVEFTTESKDSKIYPGIAREPGRMAVDPVNPSKLLVKSHPTPSHEKLPCIFRAVCPGRGSSLHCRNRRARPNAVCNT